MEKPKIVIVDQDFNYIVPLQLKFIIEYYDQIDLEVITDENYFNQKFSRQQKVDILIISEQFFNDHILNHQIANIFIMVERPDYSNETTRLNVHRIYKYTSVKDIFTEITGRSSGLLRDRTNKTQESQIILFYSAQGGTGKTTIALMLAQYLSKQVYKKILYINAAHLQEFQRLLKNQSVISDMKVYTELVNPHAQIYSDIKHALRVEDFYYLPPFRGPLFSLGLKYTCFEAIAVSARSTNQYDYIFVDADSVFDEEKARLMNVADKIIIITTQQEAEVFATNRLVSFINGINDDKYIFICNKFNKNEENYIVNNRYNLKFLVSDYIEVLSEPNEINQNVQGIKNLSSLLI